MSANLFTPLPNDSFATATGLRGTRRLGQAAGTTAPRRRSASHSSRATPAARRSGTASRPRPPARCASPLEGSAYDTLLGVYRGTTVAALQEVASNDNVDPVTPWSAVNATVRRGVTYRIAIDGQNLGAGPGQGISAPSDVYNTSQRPVRPATKLSGKKGKKVSSNAGAGRERKEPRKVAHKLAGQTVWYVYRAKRPGRLTIDSPGSSNLDTLLGVYTGSKTKKPRQVAAYYNGGKRKSSRVVRGQEGHQVPDPGGGREGRRRQVQAPLALLAAG